MKFDDDGVRCVMKKLGIFIILQCALLGLAQAQGFPSKPMRILVPSPAGSSPDIRARQIAGKLAEGLGQPVVVENRPGGAGLVAAREAAGAAPDGHTLLLALINNAIGDVLKSDPCCRLNHELLPVSRFTMTPLVMVVHPSLKTNTIIDYVQLAKQKPGGLTYASAGRGSISQLVGEWLKSETGTEILEVPYKGVNAELPDLMGGQVVTAFVVPQVIIAPVKAQKLRAVAVMAPARVNVLPDVPTTREAGLPGLEAIVWNGIFVPAGTPRNVIQALHRELVRAFDAPDIRDQVAKTGSTIAGDTPEEFAAFIRAENDKWAKVIKDAKITAN
jgi:tripartite-type tricarboxylate transporter receptor subunit TctC